jgi:hypothetical protein
MLGLGNVRTGAMRGLGLCELGLDWVGVMRDWGWVYARTGLRGQGLCED